jgi:hypothetical protein
MDINRSCRLLTTLARATRVSRSAGALALGASKAAAAMSALLAGLMGINLAIGKLWKEVGSVTGY